MPNTILSPPFSKLDQLADDLKADGYAVLSPSGVCELIRCSLAELEALQPAWNDLPLDDYLKDGGHYRRRRHSCFVVDGLDIKQVPHRAHWQSLDYNALHGGMKRLFEPITPATVDAPVWPQLLQAVGQVCSTVKGQQPWYVEAHPFRIDTAHGIGRPTPEGAHRDGVDFVAIFLVGRVDIKGGESRIFEAGGPNGKRFTLTEPWTLLLLDDTRVIHESTPILPTAEGGYRDTLVLTYRAGGFQEEGS
ncbi:MAG: 2OG-Fe dioxygenase family protein [Candidatus Manganitrophaceae bacterium]